MRALEAHSRLVALGQSVFRTADAAACLRVSNPHANKILTRLAQTKHVIRLSHGQWAFPEHVDILVVPTYLTAPFPSYLSLQTALYYHDMVSQIPSVTYAVSLARTKRHVTPIGVVSVHHVQPNFFFGYTVDEQTGARIATPEKALVDLLYLGPAKSGLFRSLPELELPSKFRIAEARRMIGKIGFKRRRTLVMKRFESILTLRTYDGHKVTRPRN